MKPYVFGNGTVINLDQVCELRKDKNKEKYDTEDPVIVIRFAYNISVQPFVKEELRNEVFDEIIDICRNLKNQ